MLPTIVLLTLILRFRALLFGAGQATYEMMTADKLHLLFLDLLLLSPHPIG